MITTVVCSITTRPMICKMVRPIENRRGLEKRGLFSQICRIFCVLILFTAFSLFFSSRNVHVDDLNVILTAIKVVWQALISNNSGEKVLTTEQFLSILVRNRYRNR